MRNSETAEIRRYEAVSAKIGMWPGAAQTAPAVGHTAMGGAAVADDTWEERLWASVEVGHPLSCWVWTGYKKSTGYGRLSIDGRMHYVHRLAWRLLRGPIPDGMETDHLCRNRACVNPDHLEMVDHHTNSIRSESFAAKNAVKTHCKRGHEFTPENTREYNGSRWCRACTNMYERAKRAIGRGEVTQDVVDYYLTEHGYRRPRMPAWLARVISDYAEVAS